MALKSQPKHQGPVLAGGHYPTQQASATNSDRAGAIAKAKTIENLVAPIFSFSFTPTYTSELEVSDFEDMLCTATETTIQVTTTQDQKCTNRENQIRYSYAIVARSWDQQSQIQQGKYSTQNHAPFGVWESHAPVNEPFHAIGEVAFESVGCDGTKQKRVAF